MKKAAIVAFLVFAALGCRRTMPGHTWAEKDNPVVTVQAGTGARGIYYYIVDTKSQLCFWTFRGWGDGGGSSVPIPCCNLKRVPQAAKYITWSTTGCAPVPASAPPPPTN